MQSATENRVISLIADQLGLSVNEVTPDKSIGDDLGADSLDQFEIIMAAEEEFELEISDDDAFKVNTVQQAIDLINHLVA